MNTKSALAIVAAALACLSAVAWAATSPQSKTGSIDGSTTTLGGTAPPNSMVDVLHVMW